MSFASGFSAGAGAVMDARRFKEEKKRRDQQRDDDFAREARQKEWLEDQRKQAMEADMAKELRQQEFQKQMQADSLHSALQRERENRMAQQDRDFQLTLERERDRGDRNRFQDAQIEELKRRSQTRQGAPAATPFQQKLQDIAAFDSAKAQGIDQAMAALASGDIQKIAPTQERLSRIAGMDPTSPQAPRPQMGQVEMPYGPADESGVVNGKAKYQIPVEEIRQSIAAVSPGGQSPAQQAGARLSPKDQQQLDWAKKNPAHPDAKRILAYFQNK